MTTDPQVLDAARAELARLEETLAVQLAAPIALQLVSLVQLGLPVEPFMREAAERDPL